MGSRARRSLLSFPGKEASSCTLFSPSASISVFAKFYPSIDAPTMPETPFPLAPAMATFTGPIDTMTFRLRPDLGLTDHQKNAYGFVRLYTYFQTPDNSPPYTGTHVFQVLVFIPIAKNPWAERFKWLKGSTPFDTHGQSVSVAGPVVGILDPSVLVESCRPDDDSPILVVIPQLLTFPPGKERMPVIIKTEPTSTTAAQSVTPVAGPSTPTPKRVSRNAWSSPNKPRDLTTHMSPSRQTLASTAETLHGSDDNDLSKDPNDATEVAIGMFCFVFLYCK